MNALRAYKNRPRGTNKMSDSIWFHMCCKAAGLTREESIKIFRLCSSLHDHKKKDNYAEDTSFGFVYRQEVPDQREDYYNFKNCRTLFTRYWKLYTDNDKWCVAMAAVFDLTVDDVLDEFTDFQTAWADHIKRNKSKPKRSRSGGKKTKSAPRKKKTKSTRSNPSRDSSTPVVTINKLDQPWGRDYVATFTLNGGEQQLIFEEMVTLVNDAHAVKAALEVWANMPLPYTDYETPEAWKTAKKERSDLAAGLVATLKIEDPEEEDDEEDDEEEEAPAPKKRGRSRTQRAPKKSKAATKKGRSRTQRAPKKKSSASANKKRARSPPPAPKEKNLPQVLPSNPAPLDGEKKDEVEPMDLDVQEDVVGGSGDEAEGGDAFGNFDGEAEETNNTPEPTDWLKEGTEDQKLKRILYMEPETGKYWDGYGNNLEGLCPVLELGTGTESIIYLRIRCGQNESVMVDQSSTEDFKQHRWVVEQLIQFASFVPRMEGEFRAQIESDKTAGFVTSGLDDLLEEWKILQQPSAAKVARPVRAQGSSLSQRPDIISASPSSAAVAPEMAPPAAVAPEMAPPAGCQWVLDARYVKDKTLDIPVLLEMVCADSAATNARELEDEMIFTLPEHAHALRAPMPVFMTLLQAWKSSHPWDGTTRVKDGSAFIPGKAVATIKATDLWATLPDGSKSLTAGVHPPASDEERAFDDHNYDKEAGRSLHCSAEVCLASKHVMRAVTEESTELQLRFQNAFVCEPKPLASNVVEKTISTMDSAYGFHADSATSVISILRSTHQDGHLPLYMGADLDERQLPMFFPWRVPNGALNEGDRQYHRVLGVAFPVSEEIFRATGAGDIDQLFGQTADGEPNVGYYGLVERGELPNRYVLPRLVRLYNGAIPKEDYQGVSASPDVQWRLEQRGLTVDPKNDTIAQKVFVWIDETKGWQEIMPLDEAGGSDPNWGAIVMNERPYRGENYWNPWADLVLDGHIVRSLDLMLQPLCRELLPHNPLPREWYHAACLVAKTNTPQKRVTLDNYRHLSELDLKSTMLKEPQPYRHVTLDASGKFTAGPTLDSYREEARRSEQAPHVTTLSGSYPIDMLRYKGKNQLTPSSQLAWLVRSCSPQMEGSIEDSSESPLKRNKTTTTSSEVMERGLLESVFGQ